MDKLDQAIKTIAEHYGNDLSAFLRDAYSDFPNVPDYDTGNRCHHDYSWCIAKAHTVTERNHTPYCYYHSLTECFPKE